MIEFTAFFVVIGNTLFFSEQYWDLFFTLIFGLNF